MSRRSGGSVGPVKSPLYEKAQCFASLVILYQLPTEPVKAAVCDRWKSSSLGGGAEAQVDEARMRTEVSENVSVIALVYLFIQQVVNRMQPTRMVGVWMEYTLSKRVTVSGSQQPVGREYYR